MLNINIKKISILDLKKRIAYLEAEQAKDYSDYRQINIKRFKAELELRKKQKAHKLLKSLK